jgi:hypothetical protein
MILLVTLRDGITIISFLDAVGEVKMLSKHLEMGVERVAFNSRQPCSEQVVFIHSAFSCYSRGMVNALGQLVGILILRESH